MTIGWQADETFQPYRSNIFNPLASIDIVAHEFGHGITHSNIGWSGGLGDSFNEGMSDIWAVIFEHAINPNSTSIWKIGEDVVKNHACLRNLEDTYSSGALTGIANTYGHYLSQTDIYEVGGVLSHWFYLLVNGGNGINGNGDSYRVYPIGFDLAENLVIEAVFNSHLRNTTTFEELRTAFYQAAISLGEYYVALQVANAWFAVGVGERPEQISILGNSHVCNSQIFSVNNIANDVNVTWDFLYSSSTNMLQGNVPATNQCTLSNPNNYYVDDYIVATITKNGQALGSLQKYVYAYYPFYGTYSQTLRPVNKYGYSAIPETNFTASDYIIVNPNCYIFVESPKFKNMTMSCIPHNYSTASISRIDDETIRLYVNYEKLIRYGTVTIYGTSPEGCDDFSFTVYVTANKDMTIPILAINGEIENGILSLSLNNDTESINENSSLERCSLSGWDIRITECTTGQCVYTKSCQNDQLRIDISKWKHGIYSIQAIKGDQVVKKKIWIK